MTAPSPTSSPLDRAVSAAIDALIAREFPAPQVLCLLGTGEGTLAGRLEDPCTIALDDVLGTPACWRASTLRAGFLQDASVWILEDTPFEAAGGGRGARVQHAWARGFPVWLAAAAGARVCLYTTGARALGPLPEGPAVGDLFLVRDHLNLSGSTPLLGLGATGLGPLFPDQTRLHDPGLRELAQRLGRERGLPLAEGVLACTAGPALATRAEAAFYVRAGAHASSQDTAGPLIACAHAGLDLCVIAPVLAAEHGAADVESMARAADACAPDLEELLLALAGALAQELAEEGGG